MIPARKSETAVTWLSRSRLWGCYVSEGRTCSEISLSWRWADSLFHLGRLLNILLGGAKFSTLPLVAYATVKEFCLGITSLHILWWLTPPTKVKELKEEALARHVINLNLSQPDSIDSLEIGLGLVDDDLANRTVAVLLQEPDDAAATERVQTLGYGGGVD